MSNPKPGDPLTDREIETLDLAAHGTTNSQIAGKFGISEDTVKSHLRCCYRKLGARDRAHAVAIAYQRGHLLMPAGATPRVLPTAAAARSRTA